MPALVLRPLCSGNPRDVVFWAVCCDFPALVDAWVSVHHAPSLCRCMLYELPATFHGAMFREDTDAVYFSVSLYKTCKDSSQPSGGSNVSVCLNTVPVHENTKYAPKK